MGRIITNNETGIRLPRHDGQRILPPQLLLQLVLPMHVPNRPCITMPDSWLRRSRAIRIRQRSHWKMGWYSHRDYRCLQIIGLDCFNFEAHLGWEHSYWNQGLTRIPSNMQINNGTHSIDTSIASVDYESRLRIQFCSKISCIANKSDVNALPLDI